MVLTRLLGARVPRAVWVGLLVALVGVVVITGVDFSTHPRALAGDALALAGGVFSAAYIVIGGEVRGTGPVSTTAYTFICYAASALVLIPVLALTRTNTFRFGVHGWLIILGVTLFSQIIGHTVFNSLLATMTPAVVSTAILLEVPGASLIAGVFLHQSPPPVVYVGLALILAGLVVVVRSQRAPTLPIDVPPA